MKLVLALVLSVVALALMVFGSAFFVDVRSESLRGPGAQIEFIDRWPTPGSAMGLEVEAHGGERAGLVAIVVSVGGQEVLRARGSGANWGTSIDHGKNRGSDRMELDVPIPANAVPDRPLALEAAVDFSVAMPEGKSFSNQTHHQDLVFNVSPVAPGQSMVPRVLHGLRALPVLLVWIAALVLLFRSNFVVDGMQANAAAVASVLISGALVAGMLGYWLFGVTVSESLGSPPALAAVLTFAFLVVPTIATFSLTRARKGTVAVR